MMSDYPRVLALLSDLEKPSRAKEVYEGVQAFSEQPYFINLLQHALKDPSLTYNLKLNAAVTLNRVIKNKFDQISGMRVLQVLMDVIFNFDIDIKHKIALQSSLSSIFQETEPDIIGEIMEKAENLLIQAQTTMQSIVQQAHITQSASSQDNIFQILKIIILIARCLSESQNHRKELVQSLKKMLQPSLQVVNLTINPMTISVLGELCIFWREMLQKMNNCKFSESLGFADEMCLNLTLNQWISQLYEIGCSPAQKCFINPGMTQLAEGLNRMKKNAASLHKLVMVHFSRIKSNRVEQLWKITLEKGYSLINTVTVYASHLTYFFAYQQFTTQLLGVLIVMIKENRQYFTSHYANIMHMVIFPLLAVTQEEIVLFQNDSQEFNYLAEDCCDQQRYCTIKTETSRLLQATCDQNQDATQYAIQHALISLKVRLSLDQNFQSQAGHFLSIQAAFLVLSILSYCLSKHPNELQQLRAMLVPKNIEGRISHLELARIFTFLAYNYTEIYPNPMQGEGWVKWALNSDSQRTVILCALDFISNIVNQYFSESFLLEFAERVFPHYGESSLRLATLLKIMSAHLSKISQDCMVVILQKLLQTIKLQIELYKRHERSHTLDIVSILQMIRKVIDNYNSSQRLKQEVMKYIELLSEMVSIHLDDQIVKIVTSIIKQEQSLSQHMINLLDVISALFQDGRQSQLAYLLLFNCYLVLGNAQIRQKVIAVISQGLLALHVHTKDNPTSARDKIGIASIYLLLQNVVATFGNEITPTQLNSMRDLALYLIPESDNPEDKIQPMVIARALNLLFLIHMHKRDQTALRKLLIFQDSYIFRGYDLKVLSACLSKDIFRDGDVVAITEMINILTKAIGRTRDQMVVIRSKKNVNSIKSDTKIRIKRIEDYEQILKFVETPFSKEIVPEAELRKVIDQMRSNNPFAYQAIIKSLTTPVYSCLKKVISQVTIDGRKRNILHVGEIKEKGATLEHIQFKKRMLADDNEGAIEEDEEDSKLKIVQKKKKREICEEIQ